MLSLRALTEEDGRDVYEMLQDIGADENGYVNRVHGMRYADYRAWLKQCLSYDLPENRPDWMVQQSTFWLYDGDRPVGMGKIRHTLTDALRENGGHIGYAIRRSARGQGYGTRLLPLLLTECRKLGIPRVLLTAHADNVPSRRVIERAGGVLERENGERAWYWIELADN